MSTETETYRGASEPIDNRPRVFLVEELRGKDASAASEHGRLTVLFGRDQRRPPVFRPTEFCECAVRKLVELCFDPERDRVVLAGALIPNALLLAAVTRHWGRALVLMYDAGAEQYVAKSIDEEGQSL